MLMVLFGLGLMAKPMVVTLPFVLLLLDYWPLNRLAGGPCQCSMPTSSRRSLGPTAFHGNGADFLAGKNVSNTTLGSLRSFPQLLIEKIPLFILVALSCVVTVWAQQQAMASNEQLPFPWRIANALVSYVAYLGQFSYPAGLAVFYPHPSLNCRSGKSLAQQRCWWASQQGRWRAGDVVPTCSWVGCGMWECWCR